MPQCRCKMCGGIINYNNDQKVAVCEFCDTEQTIVNGDNEIKINLFNRANNLRLNNEFDKALATYENILKDYPNDAEAHWGICLCRYGIEYVDDPATHKKIPTCHRTLFNSIFDDVDYNEAINNSDVVARNIYIKEAEQIDKIQKTILSISQKEEPYDIFICYKETDKSGNRTKDSVIAQEIYTELTHKGYKVFFSRITLESKLGSEYEPIIFAALQSSKVMLVVGTKEEYFNAPWVKNEWSRFLEFMKGRRGKYLIPCYKDMEAYDMPDEFLPLQSQSIDKLGFLQDLIRGINKIFDREEKPKIETTNTNVDPKINNLIKRIKLSIEDKDYIKAKEFIEELLDIDVECVDAYVALLLIDLNLSSELELTNLYTPLDTNKNYIKALRFASSSYKKVLEGYNESIKNNILERRNDNIYNEAMSFYKNGQYDLAISKFKLILDYKDSKELITKINEEKEIQRKDEIYKTNISYIKGLFNIPNLSDYRNKLELYINNLKTIIDYKDTKELIEKYTQEFNDKCIQLELERKERIYNDALIFYKNKQYDAAISKLKEILDYKDSKELITKINEEKEEARKNKIYEEYVSKLKDITSTIVDNKTTLDMCITNLLHIEDYKDTKEIIEKYSKLYISEVAKREEERKERIYNEALAFYNEKKYDIAINKLKEILDHKDSKELVNKFEEEKKEYIYSNLISRFDTFLAKEGNINKNEFNKLIDELNTFINYKDTKELIEKYTQEFNVKVEKEKEVRREKKDKIIKYSKIGGPIFLGVLTIILLTIFLFVPLGKYNNAMDLIDNKQYDEAREILKELNIKDSKEQIELVNARECFDNLDYETGIQYVMNVDGQVEVNYDTDGGETLVTNEIIKKSKYINNDSNKTGYTFYGWSLKSYELDHKEYYATLNLKADYKPTEYNITLNLDGGSFESDVPSTYTFLDEVNIPNPSKVGYEFIGWTGLGLEEPTLDLVIPKGSVGNKEYTANYKVIYYEINYYLDDGILHAPKTTYTVEEEFTLKIPTKVGYEFIGWTGTDLDEPTLSVTIEKGSTGDREYIAIWEVETYTITYNLNGGTFVNSNPISYNIHTETFSLKLPTKEGYEFIGWTGTGLSEPTLCVTVRKGSTGDREYTANWELEEYTITYNLNGGTLSNSNSTTYSILTATFTLNNPSKEGYEFIGWTGTGLSEPTLTVTITKGSIGDREYTANWQSAPYKITYNLNGGTLSKSNPMGYNVTSATFTLNNPTKEGYEFLGWTGTGLSAATKTVTIAKGSTGDREYTANWKAKTYTLTCFLEGGTLSKNNPISYNIETETFTLNNPTKEGYEFIGWTGTGLSSATKTVTITKGSIGDREYTANWKAISYKITYNLNGGTLSKTNPSTYNIETTTFTLNNPTKEGYEFLGWTGTGLNSVTKTVTITKGSIGDRSYTANYKAKTYTLTCFLEGGTLSKNNPISYNIETETFTLNNPTKEGYEFIGWTGTGLSSATKTVTITKGSIGDREYTANWKAISYKITYNLNGGTLSKSNPTGYDITSTTFTLNNPTKEGYKFIGWTGTDLDEPTLCVTVRKGSTGNRSYTANYKAKTYTLTCFLEGGTLSKSNPSTYNIETATFTLNNPTKEGYEFIGWTGTGLDEPTLTVTIAKGSTGDREYTANWSSSQYIITYNLNGGTLSKSNPTGYDITSTTFTLNNPTKEGYKFIGWTGTDLDEPTLTVTISKGSTGNRSYTANYKAKTYTLTCFLEGGTLSKNNPSTYNIETATFTLNNPTKEGYEFIGWTGTDLDEPTLTVTITKGSIGDREYTANWESEGLSYILNADGVSYTVYRGNYNKSEVIIPAYYEGLPVTNIKDFSNCNSLTSIIIPSSVTSIGMYAFSNCNNLTSIEVDKNNQHYKSIDGNLYNKEGTELIQYAIGKIAASFTIPSSVTSIENSAFSRCNNLTSIIIPSSVTSIGMCAFYYCNKLSNIEIPSSVTIIGSGAFESCKNLKEIVIPEGVTSIGYDTFYNCESLTSITIPSSVTSISYRAFYHCKSLTSITIPSSVTSIAFSTFAGCNNLTSITIPSSVTSIGDHAFHGCNNLTSITIPSSVTSIGDNAFAECDSLTIYCEASGKPSGWSVDWNPDDRPVYWGYKN